jgi:hypothetical protein
MKLGAVSTKISQEASRILNKEVRMKVRISKFTLKLMFFLHMFQTYSDQCADKFICNAINRKFPFSLTRTRSSCLRVRSLWGIAD